MIGRNMKDALAGVGMLLVLAGLALVVRLCTGCTAVQVSRAQARGAVTAAAEAVVAMDGTCAAIAYQRRDRDMALHCAYAFDIARPALLVSATAVDRWDDLQTSRDSLACAMKTVAAAIAEMTHELRDAGVAVPAVVDDAQALLPLAGICPNGVPVPLVPDGG